MSSHSVSCLFVSCKYCTDSRLKTLLWQKVMFWVLLGIMFGLNSGFGRIVKTHFGLSLCCPFIISTFSNDHSVLVCLLFWILDRQVENKLSPESLVWDHGGHFRSLYSWQVTRTKLFSRDPLFAWLNASCFKPLKNYLIKPPWFGENSSSFPLHLLFSFLSYILSFSSSYLFTLLCLDFS